MDLGLSGKRALVFGAGGGLGKAVALSLAKEGAHVVLAGRTQEKIDATASVIRQLGGHADALVWDVRQIDQISSLHGKAEERLNGPVEILFNNGGGPAPSLAQGQPLSTWQEQFENLVLSVIGITDAVLPAMKNAQWGRVLTNASSGVLVPIPNLAMSNSLRSALVGWSKTLANEVASFGITVNMVLPGRIATDRLQFLDESRSKREGVELNDLQKKLKAAIPAGRYGDPAEYGDVVAFLASKQASYVTGSMIRVDGGAISSI